MTKITKYVLGKECYSKFAGENSSLQLWTVFFDKCHLFNDLLETKGLFLRIYDRRNKFRYAIKKGVTVKNNTRFVSLCDPKI